MLLLVMLEQIRQLLFRVSSPVPVDEESEMAEDAIGVNVPILTVP